MAVLIGIYTAVFVAMAAAYIVLGSFVAIDNPAMGIVIAACAAMSTAQTWVSREKAVPESRRAWKLALACALITTALSAIVGAAGLLGEAGLLREMLREATTVVPLLAIVVMSVHVLVIRLGLWIGTRLNRNLVASASPAAAAQPAREAGRTDRASSEEKEKR